ncbi:MAG: phosphoenolpyruvate--protein phosphotransferase [Rhodospirillales bacterium]|nr:phosphoenolpyruvate--protein phosphotransferase [Rhodospirillales bacterium]MSP79688.1 phosphoenolpyruvate--protein phosphotransferase [Rhodospirillales bacterium]
MTPERRPERSLKGLGVSPGIAIGPAYVRASGTAEVPTYTIAARAVEPEIARLDAAVERAKRQIGRLRIKARGMRGAAGEELAHLLDAYGQMLGESRLLRGARARIEQGRINAEAAVEAEIVDIGRAFAQMKDPYLAARLEDIRGIGNRLVRNLTRAPVKPFSAVPRGAIIVADMITPAGAAQMDPARVMGCAATVGGAEGHTAIMARALGLPAVLGVAGLLDHATSGTVTIVDGDSGRVILDPAPATLAAYERRREERLRDVHRLARLRGLPAATRDGTEIRLEANVELPLEMDAVRAAGAAGVGLLRTEFMFMNRDDLPGEDEQAREITRVVAAMDGRPVTVRTLDIGADKLAAVLTDGLAGGGPSALGLRGIRLSLKKRETLETQFRAILRASAHGPVRILLPMVTTPSEVRKAREILERVAQGIRRRRGGVPEKLPPVGAMIEVPGAALAADALAKVCDFFAVGSNDLTMYTLAADRANETVAHLFDPLHPAVLRLMQFASEAAVRAGIPVSICGEIAGDPRFAALLVGLGFRELSMAAANLPRVKQRIRAMDALAARHRALLIMDQVDAVRIAMLLDDFNALQE